MSLRKFLSSILPKGVLSPQEKEYEFMTPYSEKPEWREPVQSLLKSILCGGWDIKRSQEFKGTTQSYTYTLSHMSLGIKFSIIREMLHMYGKSPTVNFYYGEDWLSKSEKIAVYNAAAHFYTASRKATLDARNTVREQEFMQLTKEI